MIKLISPIAIVAGGATAGVVVSTLMAIWAVIVQVFRNGDISYVLGLPNIVVLGSFFMSPVGVMVSVFIGLPYAILQHVYRLGFAADVCVAVFLGFLFALIFSKDMTGSGFSFSLTGVALVLIMTLAGVAAAYVYRSVVGADKRLRLRLPKSV